MNWPLFFKQCFFYSRYWKLDPLKNRNCPRATEPEFGERWLAQSRRWASSRSGRPCLRCILTSFFLFDEPRRGPFRHWRFPCFPLSLPQPLPTVMLTRMPARDSFHHTSSRLKMFPCHFPGKSSFYLRVVHFRCLSRLCVIYCLQFESFPHQKLSGPCPTEVVSNRGGDQFGRISWFKYQIFVGQNWANDRWGVFGLYFLCRFLFL